MRRPSGSISAVAPPPTPLSAPLKVLWRPTMSSVVTPHPDAEAVPDATLPSRAVVPRVRAPAVIRLVVRFTPVPRRAVGASRAARRGPHPRTPARVTPRLGVGRRVVTLRDAVVGSDESHV